jgi:hypothetical protein
MGLSLELTIPDATALTFRFSNAGDVLQREAESAMQDALAMLADAVRERTPVDTGYLRGSIQEGFEVAGFTSMEGSVFTTVDYAPFVEEGHAEIVPRRAHVLRLENIRPDGTQFRPRTKAVAGIFMFRDALEAVRDQMIDRFGFALDKLSEYLAGKQ